MRECLYAIRVRFRTQESGLDFADGGRSASPSGSSAVRSISCASADMASLFGSSTWCVDWASSVSLVCIDFFRELHEVWMDCACIGRVAGLHPVRHVLAQLRGQLRQLLDFSCA